MTPEELTLDDIDAILDGDVSTSNVSSTPTLSDDEVIKQVSEGELSLDFIEDLKNELYIPEKKKKESRWTKRGRTRFIHDGFLNTRLDPIAQSIRTRFLSCNTDDDLWVLIPDDLDNVFTREDTKFTRLNADTLQIKVDNRTFIVKVTEDVEII